MRIRLFDLRTAEGRAGALAALVSRHQSSPSKLELRAWGWVRRVVPLLCLAFAFVAYLWTGSGQAAVLGAVVAFVLLLAVAVLVFAVYGVGSTLFEFVSVLQRFIRRQPARDPDLPRLLVAGSPPLDAGLERFAGRVRVVAPAASPLARKACAAYRVIGEGPLGQVDDGGGTTFEIVSDDGTARVVLGSAALDIPVPSAPVTMRPDGDLTRFLEQRGIFPERGPVRLAEGLLEEGDRVEVFGRSTKTTETDGYRGQKDVAVFTEQADAPLLVRKL